MKLLMRDEAKGKEHTIFVTIFAALMVMLVIMVMLMASAIGVSGVTLRLDENAVDILDKQVENRARYIEAQLQQAQDLTELSSFINDKAQARGVYISLLFTVSTACVRMFSMFPVRMRPLLRMASISLAAWVTGR